MPDGIPRYQDLPGSLVAPLESQVDARPDAEAVVELGGQRLTYQQLWDRAARVAGGLRAAGLEGGDRVAVRYPAGVNWVLAFWGNLMAGGIAVAVNTRFAAPEVEFVLDDAGVKVDLARRPRCPTASRTLRPGCGTPTWRRCSTPRAPPGTPRACRPRTRRSSRTDHVHGDRSGRLHAAPPAVRIAETDVSGVRWVGYGGAPIAPTLVRSLQDSFPGGRVFNGYGMTETASLVTVLPHDDAVEHADSVGYAVLSVELAIVPPAPTPRSGSWSSGVAT